ncbi:MAG: class I SAM-dependent methyltransferase, partial [Pseudonocardiaceae bacterium]
MSATLSDLVRLTVSLGADSVGGSLSPAEKDLITAATHQAQEVDSALIGSVRRAIAEGADPLGELFYDLRDPATRRASGAVYTPDSIVDPMAQWVLAARPVRVVDAGSGSGRYTAALLRADQTLPVVAVDHDPVATLMTRAVAAVLGGKAVSVKNADFTRLSLPQVDGRTAFVGNPPYLRHHQLPASTKAWAQSASRELGHKISGLAGLHAFFYLAVAQMGKAGDIGCFVTSAEWLDVN